MLRFHFIRLGLALVTLPSVLALACATSASPGPTSAPPPPASTAAAAPTAGARRPATERLTFQLPWKAGGTYSPFYLALKKGYYAEQGLEVDIVEGQGSAPTAQIVAAGSAPVGFVEGSVLIQSVSEELPIKGVAGIMQRNPASIIVPRSSGITTPKDLEGKKIAASPGAAPTVVLEPWLKANGVDTTTVEIVSTSPQTLLTVLLQGRVDAVCAFYSDNVPVLQARGLDASYILYADYGMNIPSGTIIANNTFAREKPDTVRRFVAAALRGVAEAQRDPAASVAGVADLATALDAPLETAALANVLSLLHTERTRGKPLGWIAKEDWEDGIDIMAEHAGLKNKPNVDDVITNEFVPEQ